MPPPSTWPVWSWSTSAPPPAASLDGTNLAGLEDQVPDCIDLVTMDLSYLAVSHAVPQFDQLALATDAQLVALVKPTYELRAASLAARPEDVAEAVSGATKGIVASKWEVLDEAISRISGSRGAIEVFVHARRTNQDLEWHGLLGRPPAARNAERTGQPDHIWRR
jgi:predicted rRNA methylase YqxC with S4 and FtsJ domains